MSTKFLFAVLIALATTACVQTTPRWDSQFGQSVRTAIASQTVNPAAADNRDPVAGIDGAAALGAQKRYEHTFAQPESRAASMFNDAAGK